MTRKKKPQNTGALQLPLPCLLPDSDWRPPRLEELPSWENAKRVAFDLETCDPHLKELGPGVRRGSFIAGFSLAIEDGPAYYVPLRHEGGDNIEEGPEKAFQYLRDQSAVFRGDLVGANLPYELDFCFEQGIDFRLAWKRDVQVAEPLINEMAKSYSLQAISERYGLPGKDTTLLNEAALAFGVDSRGGLWRLPGRYVGPYGEQDARLPLQLLRRQERIIEEENLWNIFDLESALLPVLVRMRRRGVRIDMRRLDRIEQWTLDEQRRSIQEIRARSGYELNLSDITKPQALVKLFAKINVELPKTPTGRPSVAGDVLDSIDHPVADALNRARSLNHLRRTFILPLRTHMIGDRIHCSFHQLRREKDEEGGGVEGTIARLSSSHINMQNQPARNDEIGPIWRAIYVPDEDGFWACNDYSQQEPRGTVHYAELCGLPRAFEAAEQYRNDPSTDHHSMMAKLTGLDRSYAKQIFLGLCYGMGGAKLCRKLGLPTQWVWSERRAAMVEVAGPEGQKILDKFDETVPFVRMLSKMTSKAAERRGYITTLLGRRARFPKDVNGAYDWTHKALNRLIQGSAADQTKKAMVEADRAGYALQLQVHDELDLTVGSRQEAESLAELMRTCVELRVPSKVDVELGPSWGQAVGEPKDEKDRKKQEAMLQRVAEFYKEAA